MLVFFSKNKFDAYYRVLIERLDTPAVAVPLKMVHKAPLARLSRQESQTALEVLNPVARARLPYRYRKLGFDRIPGIARLLAMQYTARVVSVLRQHQAQHVVVWNGYTFRSSCVVQAARIMGLPIVYMENGALPNTTQIDLKGINSEGSVPRDPDVYRAMDLPPFHFDSLLARKRKFEDPPRSEGEALPKRFLLVPFQVEADSQVMLFSPWIRSMDALFDTLIAQLPHLEPHIGLVFRQHPSESRSFGHLLKRQSARIRFADNLPMTRLLEDCEGVVTLNSSVGVEALCFGKPVITLSTAFYNVPGLVHPAPNAMALEQLLTTDRWRDQDERLREAFLAALQYRFLAPGHLSRADDAHYAFVTKWLTKNIPCV